jgi:hypothetical protein
VSTSCRQYIFPCGLWMLVVFNTGVADISLACLAGSSLCNGPFGFSIKFNVFTLTPTCRYNTSAGSSGDLVSVAPYERWDVDDPRFIEQQQLPPRFGTFLAGVELFDEQAFGISPAEATTMDPQQRLLLQVRLRGCVHLPSCEPPSSFGVLIQPHPLLQHAPESKPVLLAYLLLPQQTPVCMLCSPPRLYWKPSQGLIMARGMPLLT